MMVRNMKGRRKNPVESGLAVFACGMVVVMIKLCYFLLTVFSCFEFSLVVGVGVVVQWLSLCDDIKLKREPQ